MVNLCELRMSNSSFSSLPHFLSAKEEQENVGERHILLAARGLIACSGCLFHRLDPIRYRHQRRCLMSFKSSPRRDGQRESCGAYVIWHLHDHDHVVISEREPCALDFSTKF